MDIRVTFLNGRWITEPSSAIVEVYTPVRWILRAPELRTQSLLWLVHFGHGAPFREGSSTLEVRTNFLNTERQELDQISRLDLPNDLSLNHVGATGTYVAESPGDYKYDLRLQDAVTGELIGDDDPTLHVVRVFRLPGGSILAISR